MAAFHFGDPVFAVGDPVAVGIPVDAVGDPVAAPEAQAVGIPVAAVGDPVPEGESWGRAGCGTKIGGSLESNVALEDVIQPF